MNRDQNLREMSVNVNSRFTIFGNCEICECQFSLFLVILSEKCAIFVRFHVKSLKSLELDVNGISPFRADIKCDSVK